MVDSSKSVGGGAQIGGNTAVIQEQEKIKELLNRQYINNDPTQNLYAHLTEVLNYLVVHYPNDALNKFEEVSYLYKHHDRIAVQEFIKLEETKEYARHNDQVQANSEHILSHARRFFDVSIIAFSPSRINTPTVSSHFFVVSRRL